MTERKSETFYAYKYIFTKLKKIEKKKSGLFDYEFLHKLVCTTFNSLLNIYYMYTYYIKYIHRIIYFENSCKINVKINPKQNKHCFIHSPNIYIYPRFYTELY